MKTTIKIDKEVEIKTPYFGKDKHVTKFICVTDEMAFIVHKNLIAHLDKPFDSDLEDISNGIYIECQEAEFISVYHKTIEKIQEQFKIFTQYEKRIEND